MVLAEFLVWNPGILLSTVENTGELLQLAFFSLLLSFSVFVFLSFISLSFLVLGVNLGALYMGGGTSPTAERYP